MATESQPPLCVDLDGTLVRSDTLMETLIALARSRPLYLALCPFWLLRGRAYFKRTIAALVTLDVAHLPYSAALLDLLARERAAGRTLVLVTAADQRTAQPIADHLGLFHEVLASDGVSNLKGRNKRAVLTRRFGVRGYDYAGNSRADLAVWEHAHGALVVNASGGIARRVAAPVRQLLRDGRGGPRVLLRAIRVHQWLKNALIFIPLVTSHQLGNPRRLAPALLAFLAFSFCASAVYLINDLLDLEADRRHATKRTRPLAAGDLSLQAGLALVPILLAASFAVAALLPLPFALVLGTYAVATTAYSFWLKHVALADVVTLACLYTMRVIAGFTATGVEFSAWLLAFSLFFFLNLAFVKRYSELYGLLRSGDSTRKARGYFPSDLELVANLGSSSGYISVLVFAFYTNSDRVAPLYSMPLLLWLICPLQLYWIGRVWLIAHRGEMHDDPVIFALTDRVSYVVGAAAGAVLLLASVVRVG